MITSTANSKVKKIVQLQGKSRTRIKENVFIAEGIKMFEEAPIDRILELYIEDELFQTFGSGKLSVKVNQCREKGIFVETVTEEVFGKMSDTKSPQGILCVMQRFAYNGEQMIQKAVERRDSEGKRPLFLLLEDIQDPGNLGTMVRTAEGVGADGIFMTGKTVDIYNPKTIRSTMGSLYRVPFSYVDDFREVIALLKQMLIRVYAAHLKGTHYYHEIDYQEGSAFLIGNEGNGLKEETADMADCYLKIPMEGKLESLNAAVAAALFMYQSRIKK